MKKLGRLLERCQRVVGGCCWLGSSHPNVPPRVYPSHLPLIRQPPACPLQKQHEVSEAFRREQQMYAEGQEQLQASIAKARRRWVVLHDF